MANLPNPITRLANPYSGDQPGGDLLSISAAQIGGRCTITGSAADSLLYLDQRQLALLRRAVWQEIQQGSEPRIDSAFVDRGKILSEPTFAQKSLDTLRAIRKRTKWLDYTIPIFDPNIRDSIEGEIATILCLDMGNSNEFWSLKEVKYQVQFCLNHLQTNRYIILKNTGGNPGVAITPDGINFLDDRSTQISQSQQCFVAMWFDESMKSIWQNGFSLGIRDAGYSPFRIDQHHHETKIDDEIISQIRQSRFLIADFTTGQVSTSEGPVFVVRGGVYYEAGFAAGLGIPVIWTVRNDQINALHFDTRQYPHIVWSNPDDLRTRLRDRIIALLGKGPVSTP